MEKGGAESCTARFAANRGANTMASLLPALLIQVFLPSEALPNRSVLFSSSPPDPGSLSLRDAALAAGGKVSEWPVWLLE